MGQHINVFKTKILIFNFSKGRKLTQNAFHEKTIAIFLPINGNEEQKILIKKSIEILKVFYLFS